MQLQFLPFFVDPYTLTPLEFYAFKQNANRVEDGLFFNRGNGLVFPLVAGVPVFIKNSLPKRFFDTYTKQIGDIVGDTSSVQKQISSSTHDFSFSHEWQSAANHGVDTIWGQTVAERLAEHFNDLQTNETELPGRLIADVGCGNGIMCTELARRGALVVGVDYSTSVWNAEKNCQHPNVCFIQADLHFMPFRNDFFDTVYSNGVLIATPDTEKAFARVALKVKTGGKYYVWLYKRGESFGFNMFLYVTDAMRFVVNKLPHAAQKSIIEGLLHLKIAYNRLRKRELSNIGEARVELYDTLTPQYKSYHTFEETQVWYQKYGFTNIVQSHVNLYGFGALGIKA